MIIAMPWPPPRHMASSPIEASRCAQPVHQGVGDPRAGHPEEGVADRDAAAVHVELVDVDVQLAVARDHLCGRATAATVPPA